MLGTASALGLGSPDSYPPEKFVVEVFSELRQDLVQKRWHEVNVLLRLAMLSGVPMQFDATLNLICDFADDIVPYEKCLVCFWEEAEERVQCRVSRGFDPSASMSYMSGNAFNLWAGDFGRPMLITAGRNVQADAILQSADAMAALVVPLVVGNRPLGSLQLFSPSPSAFCREDAQLLWIAALIAENLLTHEYANEGLLAFAFTDFLTGLKTRGYFEQQLELEVKRAERNRTRFALLMVDIDHFKQLNDRYGHHIGDQVLRDVATILQKDMRDVDTVARYGGEEFVLILPETTEKGALLVAQRLRRAVERARFFAGSPDLPLNLTISIGVAIFQTGVQLKRELLEAADSALYSAKSSGRNAVVLHSAEKQAG